MYPISGVICLVLEWPHVWHGTHKCMKTAWFASKPNQFIHSFTHSFIQLSVWSVLPWTLHAKPQLTLRKSKGNCTMTVERVVHLVVVGRVWLLGRSVHMGLVSTMGLSTRDRTWTRSPWNSSKNGIGKCQWQSASSVFRGVICSLLLLFAFVMINRNEFQKTFETWYEKNRNEKNIWTRMRDKVKSW